MRLLSTPLHLASEYGKLQAISLLLKAGAKVNATSMEGYTPLHLAASRGLKETVGLLLGAGANPSASDCGYEPIDIAGSSHVEKMLRLAMGETVEEDEDDDILYDLDGRPIVLF